MLATGELGLTNEPEATQLGQQLEAILQAYGINADYQGATIGASFIRVRLKPRLGVKVVSILNRATDIQVQMGIATPPLISPQAGYISVDLPRSRREIAEFETYVQATQNYSEIKIALGVDLEGKLIDADLSDPNICHFLVGGTNGSGKSEFLKSVVLSLIRRYPKEVVKLALVDPKRVTFPEFENSPWLMSPVIKERDRPGRVALKTSTEADSKIILGGNQTQAAHLLGKGDLLYLNSGQLIRLQSLLVTQKHFS